MRTYLLILLATITFSCNTTAENSPESIAKMLTGEWKIVDYQWKPVAQFSEAELEEYQKAAVMQKRRFLEFSKFEFNKDKTYKMDFTGNGGDEGIWSITDELSFAHESKTYKTKDTILIQNYSPERFVLVIKGENQEAEITIEKK